MSGKRLLLILSLALANGGFAGCSQKNLSCADEDGRKAIIDEVDLHLNSQDCTSALAVIETYYSQADCGTDDIRLARASANACAGNVNFFQLLTDLSTNSILGSEMWVTLTKLFPSSLTDQRVTASQNSLESLFAIRRAGYLTPASALINASTAHPGSLIAGHRTEDSNLYGMMVSMSLVGALQNRYGDPKANWHKNQKMGQTAGNALGWENPLFVDVNACSYAGAILTMFDSIGQVGATIGSSVGGEVGSGLTTAASTFSTLLDVACDAGCVSCGMSAGSCTPCPTTLRDRYSCTSLVTDRNSCAAAGIVSFINNNPLGWQN